MRAISFLALLVMSSLADIKADIKNGRTQIKGVNLGGWLVAEHWMTKGSPAWNGVPENIAKGGEYVTMKYLGHERGDRQFDEHRRTFITERDFREIAAAGLNTVRIPVGYWIVGFDKSGGGDPEGWKVWAPGALNYLDKAIREWAPNNNLLVTLSFHAAKGSQNGMDHSSPQDPGHAYWDKYQENVNNTLDAVTFLAARYKNDPAFLGIGLLNEPTGINENVVKQYFYDAYGRIRNDVGSDMLLLTSPLLSQQGPHQSDWNKFMPPPNFQGIRHDWHKYQVWGYEGMNAEQIINFCENQLKNMMTEWDGNWIFIGEWSMATPDSAKMNDDQLRRYAKAQLDAFSKAVGGWTFWAWKFYGDDGNNKNGWSMKAMIHNGFLPHF